MEKVLLSTAYFPPVSYFAAIRQADEVYVEQFENFGKQSYRNRCNILTANGVIPLTVPVEKANSKTLIKDLRIVYSTPWQKLHFKGIESAYKNSPYYEYYIDDLLPFFQKRETFLWDLNQAVLSTVLELLRGEGDCIDLRNAIHPKPSRRTPGYEFTAKPYRQTFSDRFPFVPDLSILDLLFCCGTDACDKL